jgi:hypothetical protein
MLTHSQHRGTVTTKEAIRSIMIDVLGFEKEVLDNLRIGYSICRIIIFKLLDQFDINNLASINNFEFKLE